MLKNCENNGMEEFGLVTPTPELTLTSPGTVHDGLIPFVQLLEVTLNNMGKTKQYVTTNGKKNGMNYMHNFYHVLYVWHPSFPVYIVSTHWGRVTHICFSKLTIIDSDNGLSPERCQAIIWTNARILLIGLLGTNFSEILSLIHTFSFKKMHLKNVVWEMAAILSQPQCVKQSKNNSKPEGPDWQSWFICGHIWMIDEHII